MSDNARYWFVAEGARNGEGSKEKPFHDPWLAFHAAGPNDTVHIAAGTYFGRYDRSSWLIDSPQLTVLGGYNPEFSQRTPWQTPTIFAAYPDYECARENNMIAGGGDHTGLTLDGLFFDSAGKNKYDAAPSEGLHDYPTMDGPIASFNGKKVTIKNCVFANSATGGVQISGDGSRFENNFLVNILGLGMLELRSAPNQAQLLTVTGNSFCFAYDTSGPPFGNGADSAVGVRVQCPAIIQNNIFMGCGNSAISIYRDIDRTSIDKNLFYLMPHNTITGRMQGDTADITEANLDEFEDLGPKSASGNSVQDPGLAALRATWIDGYTRFLLARFAKPPKAAANNLRTAVGLPALDPAALQKPADQGAFAAKLAPADILAIHFTAGQGFHPIDLPATEIAAQPPADAPTYRSVDWSAMKTPETSLAQQRVELRAGLGFAQNNALLADAPMDTSMAFQIYQPGVDESPMFVVARRWTLANRQFEAATKSNNGREVENTYFIRGIYRVDIAPGFRQKATLMVESIAPAPLIPAPAERSMGRDWFVKAGSSGGDGTREKPFRDPFQALEKAEGGDAIHVAGGDYVGKLHAGQWKILIRNLALLGGYDAEFKERDPWKNPTRFVMSEEEKAKGTLQGTILGSNENSEGLVLDGFIFDGSTYNGYTPTGALDLRQSPTDTLVSLMGARAPITVRHCFFLNASCEAVSISCPFGLFENNVVVNAGSVGLHINANGPGPWIIRRNTFLFAADPTDRAGTGKSAPSGTLLVLMGRASTQVESNIFAFADNFGIRDSVGQQSVSLNNNVFAGNLFNHLTDTQYLWADSSNWERRAVADSDYASIQGNVLTLPKLPVDAGFADKALDRLFKLPSRISRDTWHVLAAQIGASVKPEPPAAAPAAEVPKPVEAPKPVQPSISDLIASLGAMKNAPSRAATPAAASTSATASGPPENIFCPVYDWKKALDLAQEGSDGPGAHKENIAIVFSAAAAKADVRYQVVTPQQMDQGLAPFDNQPVQLDVANLRESSTNPAMFPPGMTNNDYNAYFVSEPGDDVRTRISLVVKIDTAPTKVFNRVGPADKLRVKGAARVIRDPGMVAIVVDNAELVEPASN